MSVIDAMGDLEAGDWPAFPLPPGFRFYPTEDQLFEFYLMRKNMIPGRDDLCNVIQELDLYNQFPPELPDSVCFPYGSGGRKRHWYCYTVGAAWRGQRYRRAMGGFWRRSGRVKNVTGGNGGDVLLGTRTRFVFYLGYSAQTATRTHWTMSEYALAEHFEATFVLCRVFVKPRRGNNIPAKTVRPPAHESGPQQVPNPRDVLDINLSIGFEINISRGLITMVVELNNRVTPETESEADTGFHMDSQLVEPVEKFSAIGCSRVFVVDPDSFQILESLMEMEVFYRLSSVLKVRSPKLPEGDFMELDDLASPLPSID